MHDCSMRMLMPYPGAHAHSSTAGIVESQEHSHREMADGTLNPTDNSFHQPICKVSSGPNTLYVALTSLETATPQTEYRLWETPEGEQVTWQLILPKALRPSVLHQLHNTPTAGHLAVAKTLNRVRECFYWAQCHQDVRDWCRNCDLCASRKGPSRRT